MTGKIDYAIFYKEELPAGGKWSRRNSWDVFLSAFNNSERVLQCFRNANASHKHWLLLPEYQYTAAEHPLAGEVFVLSGANEAEQIQGYFSEVEYNPRTTNICIDITGFMRPQLIFVLKYLTDRKVHKVDMIYSEPVRYGKKEQTSFSDGQVTEVRQIAGFEGTHTTDTSSDLLIIGSGYDHELISHVAENKDHARKIQILGLPSLRADMYQENVLRADKSSGAIGGERERSACKYFVPANDPFITANVLARILEDCRREGQNISNLYLTPLATKPQAVGFALYYLAQLQRESASIIFPFCRTYSKETSVGISRVWKYVIELESLLILARKRHEK
jgi:hypothetical protein